MSMAKRCQRHCHNMPSTLSRRYHITATLSQSLNGLKAIDGKLDPVVGRDEEIQRVRVAVSEETIAL